MTAIPASTQADGQLRAGVRQSTGCGLSPGRKSEMKAYRRILLASFSTCPSVAQLARELKSWHPDLVIVTRGWGHARRVVRAAQQARIPVPEIMVVAPDHLLRKLLNALLALSAGVLRLPPDNFDGSLNGGYHHAADWRG